MLGIQQAPVPMNTLRLRMPTSLSVSTWTCRKIALDSFSVTYTRSKNPNTPTAIHASMR